MKSQSVAKPDILTFEPVEKNRYAIIRFRENIEAFKIPATDEELERKGYVFDEYTIKRPNLPGLEVQIRANFNEWLAVARQEEYDIFARNAREARDRLLDKSDWSQLLDAAITPESQEAMKEYRQALRDIPGQPGFPYEIAWPEFPIVEKAAVK